MDYVFFETGNDAFFSHISDVFCLCFADYFKKIVYEEVLQSGSDVVNTILIQKALVRHKTALTALNCGLFHTVINTCANTQCKGNHKVVLASDQVELFEASITKNKEAIVSDKNFIRDGKVRYSVQRAIESNLFAGTQDVVKIKISNKKDPIGYKKKKPTVYLNKYIKKAAKIGNKDGPNSFVYVRHGTISHYSFFQTNINKALPGLSLAPCDLFQGV